MVNKLPCADNIKGRRHTNSQPLRLDVILAMKYHNSAAARKKVVRAIVRGSISLLAESRRIYFLSRFCFHYQIGKAKMVVAQKSRPLSSATNEIADISTEQTTSSHDHALSDIDRRMDGLDSQIRSLNV